VLFFSSMVVIFYGWEIKSSQPIITSAPSPLHSGNFWRLFNNCVYNNNYCAVVVKCLHSASRWSWRTALNWTEPYSKWSYFPLGQRDDVWMAVRGRSTAPVDEASTSAEQVRRANVDSGKAKTATSTSTSTTRTATDQRRTSTATKPTASTTNATTNATTKRATRKVRAYWNLRAHAVVTTTIRLRFDDRWTGVRRPFDCLWMVIKVTVM